MTTSAGARIENMNNRLIVTVKNNLNCENVEHIATTLIVQLLSTKIVHFYDKSMRLCQITNIPKTNISGYGAKPISPLDSSTAQDPKWPT